ncbi:hypothetical protein F2P79_017522, partial [Pimephales promelas]
LRDWARKAHIKQRLCPKRLCKNPQTNLSLKHDSELPLEGTPYITNTFTETGDPEWTAQHQETQAQPAQSGTSQHATGKHKSEHTSDNNSAATSQTAEILKVLKAFLHETSQGDKSDILCLSARPKPDTQNTARQHQTTELTVASQSDNTKQPPQLTAAQPEHDSPVSHTRPVLTAHRSQHQPRCLNFWEP